MIPSFSSDQPSVMTEMKIGEAVNASTLQGEAFKIAYIFLHVLKHITCVKTIKTIF